MKPFLKWAGNKYKIIQKLKPLLPPGHRLIEPFVGSGAVFLNTNYPHYLLTDNNPDLINLYQLLQKEGENFIQFCEDFFIPKNNTQKRFYQLRQLFNSTQDTHIKSALFIYLNKHGFNGLCRYNSRGKFNVPFGAYSKPYFPRKELLAFYQKSHNVRFKSADFEITFKQAQPGDVIYCDPPYVPLSHTSNFVQYFQKGFSKEQQVKLAHLAKKSSQKGITTIISNHDTPFIRDLYLNYQAQLSKFRVQRTISCQGNNRIKVKELVAVFQ